MESLNKKNLALISLLLRLAIGSLLLAGGITKIGTGGIEGNIEYFEILFKDSMLPMFLVKMQATILIFVEIMLGLWLIIGYKLKLAWIVSAITLMSLAFGMMFVYKYEIVSGNYTYVVFCLFGILLSPYDEFHIGNSK